MGYKMVSVTNANGNFNVNIPTNNVNQPVNSSPQPVSSTYKNNDSLKTSSVLQKGFDSLINFGSVSAASADGVMTGNKTKDLIMVGAGVSALMVKFGSQVSLAVMANKNIGNVIKNGGDTGAATEISSSMSKSLISGVGKNAAFGAASGAVVEALIHGSLVISGVQDMRGVTANVIAGTISGAGGGVGASIASGAASLACKALGMTGTFGTILSVVGGYVGSSMGQKMVESTGLRESLIKAIGGKQADGIKQDEQNQNTVK